MADCAAVLVPTDDRYQLDLDAIRRAITPRTRAIVTVSPNNPTGAVVPGGRAPRGQRRCARDRGLFHISDEVYEYFTYGSAAHVSPGVVRRRAGAHDLAVLAVEGLRLRRLAHRLHGVPGAAARCDREGAGHGAGLPAGDLADRRGRRDGGRSGVLPAAPRRRSPRCATSCWPSCASLEPLCTVPPADGAFYCFLRVNVGGRSDARSPSG